ncbi:hypothetical protein [Streptomyces sp. V2I9]|uniref:hypothetical protein n=1 Tax=Streptomyces sp. V2I9 TaxID=3042304 RepID=UPI0027D892AF|nr:hypothetical protein [Streptomyces sp. V2I9]
MKRIRTAVVAVAATAGPAVSITPVRAAAIRTAGGNGKYLGKYGVTRHDLPNGEDEQFLVGTDYAVGTRWTKNGSWTRWTSPGKPDPLGKANAASSITVTDSDTHPPGQFRTNIYLTNTNGAFVGKTRPDLGTSWQPWDHPNCC